jgi:hypothetical protein
MRLLDRRATALPAFVVCGACVPLNSSTRDVVGRWQVECEGGKETLDLKPDGHYVYAVESPRRRLTVKGTWEVEPARESLESATVILHNGPQSCENAVTFKDVPPDDARLDPVWEWGHAELSYNPDTGGFRRIKSD